VGVKNKVEHRLKRSIDTYFGATIRHAKMGGIPFLETRRILGKDMRTDALLLRGAARRAPHQICDHGVAQVRLPPPQQSSIHFSLRAEEESKDTSDLLVAMVLMLDEESAHKSPR